MVLKWFIRPLDTPVVVRNCSRCGCKSEFKCSGNFRINAQQKKLDVWLIYKCTKCECTWNMEIFSRINPSDLDRELYQGFLANDKALASQYAFDMTMLSRNKAKALFENVPYCIDGDDVTLEMLAERPVELQICNPFHLKIRLDRAPDEKTGITRAVLRQLIRLEAIRPESASGRKEGADFRLRGDCTICFDPNKIRDCIGDEDEKVC